MLVCILMMVQTGCTALLEFRECEVPEHCPNAGDACIDGACVASSGPTTIVVDENVSSPNTVWEASSVYVLDRVVFIEPGASLTIRAGTQVRGRPGSALISESGGRLEIRGTEFAPVVFTSDAPEGTRTPGDWGGVALLGRAPVNQAGAVLEGVIEVDRAGYGGTEPRSSCGVVQYTRIEFAGFKLDDASELNGLTLAGCGSGTVIEHVQVHLGSDDGIEVFGGTVNLEHVVITRAQDDALDWDLGWTGAAQFVAIQQDANGNHGFEASNNGDDYDAEPRTAARIWNATLIGSGRAPGALPRGMHLKEGLSGLITNFVAIGHPTESVNVTDVETVQQLTSDPPALVLQHGMFFDAGESGTHYFPTLAEETDPEGTPEPALDDDLGFDEAAHFGANTTLVFDVDPDLAAAHDLEAPGWIPGEVVLDVGATPPANLLDGVDETATYAGAFRPGVAPWTANWTAYPPN